MLGVDLDYLRCSPEEMRQRFGSIGTYIAEGFGIDADHQQASRGTLTEP